MTGVVTRTICPSSGQGRSVFLIYIGMFAEMVEKGK
jgi:hypothetical protein